MVRDLSQVFASRLRSVVAYGPAIEGHDEAPLTCLALVDSIALSDLDACARLASRWTAGRVGIPLILSQEEFRRSLDAFPLEYGEILRAHERVFGENPFNGASIAREDLRRACETQIKSHLVHLRESYIESSARPRDIAELVVASAAPFAALLRNVARLNGSGVADRTEATRVGARAAGIPDSLVDAILSLEQERAVRVTDPARLFPEYLAAVEQLARVVDSWRV